MNKFVELLEQHVQWVALGIGGLFLLYVLYAFVLLNPAGVETTSGDLLTPGQIDADVNQREATPLSLKIQDQRAVAPPKGPTSARAEYDRLFNPERQSMPDLPAMAFNSPPADVKLPEDEQGPRNRVQVAGLPAASPARMIDIKSAKANVLPPAREGQPGAAAVQPVGAKDIAYVRAHYSIDLRQLAEQFRETNMPAQATTGIVAVEVYRQEKQPDGSWGEAEKVARIDSGEQLMPLPGPDANRQQVGMFRAWAESPQGQAALLRPVFYNVVAGEGPWDPHVPLKLIDPEKLRQEELQRRREEALERDRLMRDERLNRQQSRPQPDRSRRRPGGDENFQVGDSSRPASVSDLAGLELAQVRPGGPGRVPRQNDPNMFEDPAMMDPGMDPGMMDPGMPGQPVEPGAGQPDAGGLPNAVFDPRQMVLAGNDKLIGWFFDEDVKEGRTYRYNVRYAIRNPVHGANVNVVADPKLAQQFEIWSTLDDNAWSQEVTVETSTYFYLANPGWGGNSVPQSVRFEVFKWVGGVWQREIFNVAPGDRIGQQMASANFGTDAVLVDLRFDERLGKAFVLVLNPDGRLAKREPAIDRDDATRNALLRESNAATEAPAAGTGVPPEGRPFAGRGF